MVMDKIGVRQSLFDPAQAVAQGDLPETGRTSSRQGKKITLNAGDGRGNIRHSSPGYALIAVRKQAGS